MIIKRVGVWSVARMYGALSAAMGLLFGVCVALFSLVGAGLARSDSGMPAWVGTVFGAGAVILLPIFYGVMGIVAGAIGAALYNALAGVVGGVSIEAE
jgi:hypothetical protein